MSLTQTQTNRARPFQGIDSWKQTEQGAQFLYTVDGNDPVFEGHYPGNPILPGIYTLESITQGIECFFEATHSLKARLLKVSSMRFKAPLQPGHQVTFDAKFDATIVNGESLVKVDVQRDGVKAASAKLVFLLEAENA